MTRFLACVAAVFWVAATGAQPAAVVTTWRLDNLTRAGADAIEVIGAPALVATEIGPAIQFNGRTDGLLVARNPLEGLGRFTIDVLFSPDADGPVEQRFLHLQDASGENRALVELRMNAGRWALDSFLRHGSAQLTLLDLEKGHAPASWHVSTMTFDGRTLRHYVDGVEQGSGDVAFLPMVGGQASIGVRQNRVSWFKGRIHTVRVSPSVLSRSQFIRAPTQVITLWPEGVPGRRADA
jgi:hypothetical protein